MNNEITTHVESNNDTLQTSDHLPAPIAQDQERKQHKTAPQSGVPPNLIGADSEVITPEMLPLVELDQQQIDIIVQTVPGEARNVQDIYPLSPLQEGMVFHRLLNERSDSYVLSTLFELQSRADVNLLVDALQKVIDRHDILRSAVLWQGLPRPLQVVYRHAILATHTLELDPSRDPVEQLKERMRPGSAIMDVQQAPLARLQVAAHPTHHKWYALLQLHHLICDHQSLKIIVSETLMFVEGRGQSLSTPIAYRNYVWQALTRARLEESKVFFRRKLGEIEEPTAPFGLIDVHHDGTKIEEAQQTIDVARARNVRAQAQLAGISVAKLFHAAWALVVAHTSGRDEVVYGTVLLARQQRNAQAQGMLGMSVNTLPLHLQLGDLTAKGLVEHTNRELLELLDYEHAPLALAQRCSGIIGAAPLFTSLLNYRRSARDPQAEHSATASIRVLARGDAFTNYPVALTVDDTGSEFVLTVHTDRRVDPHRVIRYLQTAVQSLVDALSKAPQTAALALPILPESERHQVINSFNATQAPYPREKLVHELFEEQVERTPDAVAVAHEEKSLTYTEINCRANQLAQHLRSRGVGPDQLVAICVNRGLEMVVGLLGCLKAGGAYVPLDPAYPSARLAYMLKDAAPKALLIQERLRERLPDTAADVIALDTDWSEIAKGATSNLNASKKGLRANHLAYVIYTSGSTGTPKGVMVEHAGLLNYLQWALSAYTPQSGDAVPVSSPLAFDATITSLYCPLLSGRCAVMVTDGQELESLEQLLRHPRQWSLIKISPAHLQLLGQRMQSVKPPCTVRAVVIGGEALPPTTVELWRSIWPQVRIINEYGPTETVVGCSMYDVPQDWTSASSVSIGRPIANTQIYILNRHQLPAPIGTEGEIYIGGAGIARGYLNQPELTAERFLPDPFTADPKARIYKTGDRGRWRPDGSIEYLGRNDHQVKIRGFRIELGEIEAQLTRHAQVKEAAVIARQDRPGETRLVGYVVLQDQSKSTPVPSIEVLRTHLARTLPEHMLPSAIVRLERMPLTQNGKLDRRALPAPELDAYATERYVAPLGDVEEALAAIWQQLLHVAKIGRDDDFFDLGGHSLLAMQMAGRIQSIFSIEIPIGTLLESSTLKRLATRIVDLRRSRVLDRIAESDTETQELVEGVLSMPESKVQELLSELTKERRP